MQEQTIRKIIEWVIENPKNIKEIGSGYVISKKDEYTFDLNAHMQTTNSMLPGQTNHLTALSVLKIYCGDNHLGNFNIPEDILPKVQGMIKSIGPKDLVKFHSDKLETLFEGKVDE